MSSPNDGVRQPENRQRSGKPRKPKPRTRRREPNAGSWKPGQSGNPGGRPKSVKEVQALASTFTEEAVRALVDTMRKTQQRGHWDPKETRQSAVALLNRACGMPSQPITGEGGQPFEAGFPTLVAALRKLSGEDDPGLAPGVVPVPAEGGPTGEG